MSTGTTGTIEYQGATYITVPFAMAYAKYNERTTKGEHVAMMDAFAHGGEENQYFIVPAVMLREPKEEETDESGE